MREGEGGRASSDLKLKDGACLNPLPIYVAEQFRAALLKHRSQMIVKIDTDSLSACYLTSIQLLNAKYLKTSKMEVLAPNVQIKYCNFIASVSFSVCPYKSYKYGHSLCVCACVSLTVQNT